MVGFVAPAGTPLTLRDLMRWVRLAASTTRSCDVLRHDIRHRLDVRHVALTYTGRAGLTMLLRAMRRLAPADRDEVVLPAYTCYSVAASVVKAGLRPRIVDISPQTLDFDYQALAATDASRSLAIVATNLYGLPNDLPRLATFAADSGIFLVDDAAQALGASVGGRSSGTWGDAGLFSFDKGKNLSAIEGGVVVTRRDDLHLAMQKELADATEVPVMTSATNVLKALAYAVMLRPALYGVPARIPQLGLGRTVFTTDYPLSLMDPALAGLAAAILPRLDEHTRTRVRNATALVEALTATSVEPIRPLAGASPAFLRLPVVFPSASARTAAVSRLVAAGIGATASYPHALVDVPELQPFLAPRTGPTPHARDVAACIATLPTHAYVDDATIALIAAVVRAGDAVQPAASAFAGEIGR